MATSFSKKKYAQSSLSLSLSSLSKLQNEIHFVFMKTIQKSGNSKNPKNRILLFFQTMKCSLLLSFSLSFSPSLFPSLSLSLFPAALSLLFLSFFSSLSTSLLQQSAPATNQQPHEGLWLRRTMRCRNGRTRGEEGRGGRRAKRCSRPARVVGRDRCRLRKKPPKWGKAEKGQARKG